MTVQIITTADGSHSLLNSDLDETYHSRHGALQESAYVFIKMGFDFFLAQHKPKSINILEIGFGTGLNAWLTLQRARQTNIQVNYTSLETYPLDKSIWSNLNYAESDKQSFEQLHEAEWNKAVSIHKNFNLHKIEGSLQNASLSTIHSHIIYFDAFAPNKQPEMWALPLLKKVCDTLLPGGVFVTYCAKGQVKRDLKSLGLSVENLPGPPGKREMLRGLKL
ncbi:MAG TPA: tRNA (5-methylaminomethyl-2-thiouridine)(34)-methyltransferase MnmD [Cyclobacteriaceae bacterium]|nr:tRNA (5-methylaminomethyl-2-thiouridine)(34)-methyltransferase MnmD [Cyclobacteriaceae bacterium]